MVDKNTTRSSSACAKEKTTHADDSETAVTDVCEALLAKTFSLQLATVGEQDYPHCGYTPYLMRHDGESGARQFYIFISELALHTRDLMREPRASIMVIEDEQDASQIFARTRLYYECNAIEVEREHNDFGPIMDEYQERHGKMVNLLRQLPDFRLLRLQPVSGQFVMGFGKAYKLTGPALNEFEHSRRA